MLSIYQAATSMVNVVAGGTSGGHDGEQLQEQVIGGIIYQNRRFLATCSAMPKFSVR